MYISILRLHNVMRFGERDDTRPGEIFAPVLCHAIVPLRTAEPAFIQGGDSGSWILHNINQAGAQATVVGLGMGGNQATKVAYMCPIDLIITDIESLTGGTVTYPADVGEVKGKLTI